MTISLREATPDDAEALVAFTRELALEPDIGHPLELDEVRTVDVQQKELEEWQAKGPALFLLAFEGDRLIGELTLKPWGRLRAVRHVVTLGISVGRDARRKGVGRALIEHAISWAKEHGVLRIELGVFSTNTRAIALYEKLGFVHEGTKRRLFFFRDRWIDDRVMARWLGDERLGQNDADE